MEPHNPVSTLEACILSYANQRSDQGLEALYRAFVASRFFVPIKGRPRIENGVARPAVVRTESTFNGTKMSDVPVFTQLHFLQQWNPGSGEYAILTGLDVLSLALGLADIDDVWLNPGGGPSGRIPRIHFEPILKLVKGVRAGAVCVEDPAFNGLGTPGLLFSFPLVSSKPPKQDGHM